MKNRQCDLYSVAQAPYASLVCFGRLSVASGNLITSCKLWNFFDSIVHETRHYLFNVCRVCGDPALSLISLGSLMTPHHLNSISGVLVTPCYLSNTCRVRGDSPTPTPLPCLVFCLFICFQSLTPLSRSLSFFSVVLEAALGRFVFLIISYSS